LLHCFGANLDLQALGCGRVLTPTPALGGAARVCHLYAHLWSTHFASFHQWVGSAPVAPETRQPQFQVQGNFHPMISMKLCGKKLPNVPPSPAWFPATAATLRRCWCRHGWAVKAGIGVGHKEPWFSESTATTTSRGATPSAVKRCASLDF